jgi:hypothetical protein
VLICDESHRIRNSSSNRFTPAADRSDFPQLLELLDASKVAVFLIDDDQVVRPDEVGSVKHIRQYAEQKEFDIVEYELQAQFRCAGCDAFVSWVNNTLGISRTAHVLWQGAEGFEFKIFPDPLPRLSLRSARRTTKGFPPE